MLTNKMRRMKDPLRGPIGAALKFFGAALFGCFVSLILLIVAFFGEIGIWDTKWAHVLWVIPAVWGILGIFWFDKMLDFARALFEGFFGLDR